MGSWTCRPLSSLQWFAVEWLSRTVGVVFFFFFFKRKEKRKKQETKGKKQEEEKRKRKTERTDRNSCSGFFEKLQFQLCPRKKKKKNPNGAKRKLRLGWGGGRWQGGGRLIFGKGGGTRPSPSIYICDPCRLSSSAWPFSLSKDTYKGFNPKWIWVHPRFQQ